MDLGLHVMNVHNIGHNIELGGNQYSLEKITNYCNK